MDVGRLRYTCPRCERSLRPELSQVMTILFDLAPVLTGKEPEELMRNNETNPLLPLASIGFLLRLPAITGALMLCERAFAFVRRFKNIVYVSFPSSYEHLTGRRW